MNLIFILNKDTILSYIVVDSEVYSQYTCYGQHNFVVDRLINQSRSL